MFKYVYKAKYNVTVASMKKSDMDEKFESYLRKLNFKVDEDSKLTDPINNPEYALEKDCVNEETLRKIIRLIDDKNIKAKLYVWILGFPYEINKYVRTIY
jgi:hypothetical protein